MKSVVPRVFFLLLSVVGLFFVFMGLRWMVDPSGVAPELGLTIETGLGLSSQIGDLSAFFLVVGLCLFAGLVTGRRTWFYPSAMLLLIAAVGRIVAWVVHGAAFAPQLIVFEIIVALLVLGGARIVASSK